MLKERNMNEKTIGEIADSAAGVGKATGNLGMAGVRFETIKREKGNKKTSRVVSMDYIEPLIKELKEKTGMSETNIFKAMGSAQGNLAMSRKSGYAGLATYYMLLGLMHEKNLGPPPAPAVKGLPLDFDDIVAVFDAARLARKSLPSRAEQYKRIMQKAAAQMMEGE